MPQTIHVKTRRESAEYQVEIHSGLLIEVGIRIKSVLGGTPKLVIVSNTKVFGLYGDPLLRSLSAAGFETNVHLIGDGERFKDMKTLGNILAAFSKFGISRSDAVIGFGGGVVGDIAGFAASIHLRGVNYLQIPTTLLAMVDSSVGGKTGMNTAFGKNLAGTFCQPKGVLVDPNLLRTLRKREITAGFCECIKQGALSGKKLWEQTVDIVGPDLAKRLKNKAFTTEFEAFLRAQVDFKARVVASDERESIENVHVTSRKILNFGHTLAHALEKATNYKYLKHGEAVGYGVIFAARLSKKLGLLDEKIVNLLCDVVHRSGPLPSIELIDPEAVHTALRHDKKIVNNSLRWILLKGIGKPVIVPHDEIGDRAVRSTIKEFISSD